LFTFNSRLQKFGAKVEFVFGIFLALFFVEIVIRILAPLLGPPLVSWNTMQDAKLYKFSKTVTSDNSSIFIFGNSTALIGVNPNIVRPNSSKSYYFNAAMNGSDTYSMVRFATEKIGPLYKPKAMIFFLSEGSFRDTIDVSNHPYEVAEPSKEKSYGWVSDIVHGFYIYRYRNMIRDPMIINSLLRSVLLLSNEQGIASRWASNLDDFGYSKLPNSANSVYGGWNIDITNSSEDSELRTRLPSGTMEDFKVLSTYARKNQIEIWISTVPTLNFNLDYRLKTRELANLYHFRFLQGNDAVTRGDNFQDGVHLNDAGARQFSYWLKNEFSKISSND
jgi:hypothetical protein